MATVQEMNSLDDLRQHLASDPIQPLTGEITIEFYAHDPRINWDAHAVCVDGNAVGFTDGPF